MTAFFLSMLVLVAVVRLRRAPLRRPYVDVTGPVLLLLAAAALASWSLET
ncbi:MAG TPA: hypothetical protein VFA70_12020 [Dehalococcoidia bacterium]|nr:hypothetical protein [Dehalococcoidia bacterium]